MAEAPTLPRPGSPEGERLPDHVTMPLLALITQRSLEEVRPRSTPNSRPFLLPP